MRVTWTRTGRLSAVAVTASAGLLASAPAQADAACRNQDLALTKARTAKVERAAECLINQARAASGVRGLKAQRSLRRSSGRFASSMVRRRFFSHSSPGGSSPSGRMAGYRAGADGWRIGENLAYARRRATARKIVGQWLRSPGHRATMLNAGFRDIGVGAKAGTPRGSRRGGTFVLHVGSRS